MRGCVRSNLASCHENLAKHPRRTLAFRLAASIQEATGPLVRNLARRVHDMDAVPKRLLPTNLFPRFLPKIFFPRILRGEV